MKHEIIMIYKDDKEVKVSMPEEEIPKFFDDLNKSQAYRFKTTGRGFWTNLADIRYIITKECTPETSGQAEQIPSGGCDQWIGDRIPSENWDEWMKGSREDAMKLLKEEVQT